MNGNPALPLDEVADKSIEGMRAVLGSTSGATVTGTQLSRTTGTFEGVETRKFSYEVSYGGKKEIVHSVVFYRDGVSRTSQRWWSRDDDGRKILELPQAQTPSDTPQK